MSQGLSSNQIQKMRDKMNHIQQLIKRSQQQFHHDLIVENKLPQDINIMITVENQGKLSQSKFRTQSQITIPHHSSIKHKISGSMFQDDQDQKKDKEKHRHSQSNYNSDSHDGFKLSLSKIVQNDYNPAKSGVRKQKKFQSLNHINKYQETETAQKSSIKLYQVQQDKNNQNTHIIAKKHQGDQIKVQDQQEQESAFEKSKFGNVEIDEMIAPMQQSKFENVDFRGEEIKQNTSYFMDIQQRQNGQKSKIQMSKSHQQKEKEQSNIMPFSLKRPQDKKFIKNTIQSPEVYSYLHQQYKKNHSELNTPFEINANSSWGLSHKEQSSIKRSKQQLGKTWRIERLSPTPVKIQFKNSKQKTYTELSKSKLIFKDQKSIERQKRRNQITNKSKTKDIMNKSYQINRSQQLKKNVGKKKDKIVDKAEDLFLQRKNQFLKRIDQQKRIKNKDRSISKSGADYNTQRRSISPRVAQITERLYSRSIDKQPCQHYMKFSEIQQRQRFDLLVRQNSFVAKYIGKEQQELLFQKLRRDKNYSIGEWPMKIVNFTYEKLQKLKQNNIIFIQE